MSGERVVSAAGTPVLATGGSGDLLSGIAATLLAQTGNALHAGAVAAWAHGRAAELVTARRGGFTRGVTLADVETALADAWLPMPGDVARYPVLAELPAVGDTSTEVA
jgi:NAD(P)H-hydrate epimerase